MTNLGRSTAAPLSASRSSFGFRAAGLLSALTVTVGLATPAHAVLGGSGAPQSVHCENVGGTEDGSYCVLPNGDYCESMTLFRDNVCKTPDGTILSDEDYGSNEIIEDSGEDE